MWDEIPVITLPESAFGPMGVDLSGVTTDAGGGNAQPMFIPILSLKWADERFACHHVATAMHRNGYDPAAAQADVQAQADACACDMRSGDSVCRADAERRPCLFTEPPTSQGWQTAADYRSLPDGGLCHVRSYALLTGGDA